MSVETDKASLYEIVERRGVDFVKRELADREPNDEELTIVSNVGLHPIPYDYVKGHLHIASEGNLDFSDIKTVNLELDKIVRNLVKVLNSKRWIKIYLLPFGHSSISLTIKMTVFRLLRIETIDIFYFGGGRYDYLDRDSRNSILDIRDAEKSGDKAATA